MTEKTKSRRSLMKNLKLKLFNFISMEKESVKTEDNIDPLEKELHALKKRNKQLEMENDILKQAAYDLLQ